MIVQGIGLNNRIIVIIGILCALSGGILLTDWQALPYSDPCTKYSLFHHPELRKNYTIEAMELPPTNEHPSKTQMSSDEPIIDNKIQANVCFPKPYKDIQMFKASILKLKCTEMDSCAECIDKNMTAVFPVPPTLCFSLGYRAEKLHVVGDSYIPLREPIGTYLCSTGNYGYCACVIVQKKSMKPNAGPSDSHAVNKSEISLQSNVHVQSLMVIEESVYNVAMNRCESLYDVHGCHWIPQSRITGNLCTDCPYICRSVYRTLTFVQFCIGTALKTMSVPTSRVSTVNVILDVVDKDIQVRSCMIRFVTNVHLGAQFLY